MSDTVASGSTDHVQDAVQSRGQREPVEGWGDVRLRNTPTVVTLSSWASLLASGDLS